MLFQGESVLTVWKSHFQIYFESGITPSRVTKIWTKRGILSSFVARFYPLQSAHIELLYVNLFSADWSGCTDLQMHSVCLVIVEEIKGEIILPHQPIWCNIRVRSCWVNQTLYVQNLIGTIQHFVKTCQKRSSGPAPPASLSHIKIRSICIGLGIKNLTGLASPTLLRPTRVPTHTFGPCRVSRTVCWPLLLSSNLLNTLAAAVSCLSVGRVDAASAGKLRSGRLCDFLQTGESLFFTCFNFVEVQDSSLVVRGCNSSCPTAFMPGQWRPYKDAFSLFVLSLSRRFECGPN